MNIIRNTLSTIFLILASTICTFILSLISHYAVDLIEMIDENNMFLFWIVLIVGGTLGFWVIKEIVPKTVDFIIKLSDKISRSQKGLRFKVVGICIIVLFGLVIIDLIFTNTINGFGTILAYVLMVYYSVCLIKRGKKRTTTEPLDIDVDMQ